MKHFQRHIRRAVALSGSQKALAEKAGISQQLISWLLRTAPTVTGDVAVKIEKATGGAVTRRELRPDLFNESA